MLTPEQINGFSASPYARHYDREDEGGVNPPAEATLRKAYESRNRLLARLFPTARLYTPNSFEAEFEQAELAESLDGLLEEEDVEDARLPGSPVLLGYDPANPTKGSVEGYAFADAEQPEQIEHAYAGIRPRAPEYKVQVAEERAFGPIKMRDDKNAKRRKLKNKESIRA